MATVFISTVGADPSRDYPTVAAWLADNGAASGLTGYDLPAQDAIAACEIYNDDGNPIVNGGQISLDAWSTDETRYLEIYPGPGNGAGGAPNRHDGTPGSGVALRNTLTNAVISSSRRTIIRDIELWNSGGYISSGGLSLSGPNINNYGEAKRLIIRQTNNSRGVAFTGNANAGAYDTWESTIESSILIQKTAGNGSAVQPATAGIVRRTTADNCTVIGYAFGFRSRVDDGLQVINCITKNCTTPYESGFSYAATSTNNADSNGSTAPPEGLNPYPNDVVDADFVDVVGDDYHLVESSGLRTSAANRIARVDKDIDFEDWPGAGAWDIGADYFPSAAAVGTIYWAVYPSGQADPTASEIINGTVPNGFFGNDPAPTVTTVDFTGSVITGLTPNTSYKLAAVWDDTVDQSNVDITGPWSTLPLAAYDETGDVDYTLTVEATEVWKAVFQEFAQVDYSMLVEAKENYTAPDYPETGAVAYTMTVTATETFTEPGNEFDERGQVNYTMAVTATEQFTGPSYNETAAVGYTMTVDASESFGTGFPETGQIDYTMAVNATEVWAPPAYVEQAAVDYQMVVTARETFDTPSRLPGGITTLVAERIGGFFARKI